MAKRKSRSQRKANKELEMFKHLYFDVKEPSSFSGKRKFIQSVKKRINSDKSTLQRASDWLDTVDTYSIHRPINRPSKSTRRMTITAGIDQLWQADLTDLPKFVSYNRGHRYILFCIDVFSRKAYASALKTKTSTEVSKALQDIFKKHNRWPKFIQSDLGTEFRGQAFVRLMKEYGIHHYHSENRDTKASVVERLQRTIKDRLYRYFTHTASYNYIDSLDDIVESYNNSTHTVIGMTPNEVTPQVQEEVWNHQYYPDNEAIDTKLFSSHFTPGERVRVSKIRSTFDKSSLPNWSDELFVIDRVLPTKPVTYSLVDLSSEPITGTWYSWELQKANKRDDVYKIEKVLRKKKVNRRWKYLVKFQGYDNSFNQWVDDVFDYRN